MIEDLSYQETLDYLYSFVDYSLQRNLRNAPGKFDLGRMYRFLDLLGRPQDRYPIIHVAGTKGKGSVSALTASALHAAGYRVGLYTSPHLQDYVERIQVDQAPIPHASLVSLVEELKPHIQAVPQISTFEISTALAFYYFAIREVEAAVVEVGLGGRLDATNVVNPIVSAITSLSYDHTHLLGNTLAEIAAEKAGIIKEGVPVVLAPQKEEARQVIERIAAERAAPIIQVSPFTGQGETTNSAYLFEAVSHDLERQVFRLWPARGLESQHPTGQNPILFSIPLLGEHQVENAAVAYAVLRTAEPVLPIQEGAIHQGFTSVSWPGRFEILQHQPPVVIDSAHNRDSAKKLRQALKDYYPDRPVILIIGASEDKDIEGIFSELMEGDQVAEVIASQAVHPRAIDPDHLVTLAQRFGRPVKSVVPVHAAYMDAMQRANAVSRDGKMGVVLATGSLFIAAEVRTAWQSLQAESFASGKRIS